MKTYGVTLLKGDGIGPEIVGQAVKVLNAVGKKYDFAVSLLQKAENLYEKVFGYASDERASVVYEEALMSIKAGKNEDAVLYFEMLKDILKDNAESKFADEKYFEKYKKILEKY